jgi:hypothetical protein
MSYIFADFGVTSLKSDIVRERLQDGFFDSFIFSSKRIGLKRDYDRFLGGNWLICVIAQRVFVGISRERLLVGVEKSIHMLIEEFFAGLKSKRHGPHDGYTATHTIHGLKYLLNLTVLSLLWLADLCFRNG